MARGTLSSGFHSAPSISDVNFFPEAIVAVKDTRSVVQVSEGRGTKALTFFKKLMNVHVTVCFIVSSRVNCVVGFEWRSFFDAQFIRRIIFIVIIIIIGVSLLWIASGGACLAWEVFWKRRVSPLWLSLLFFFNLLILPFFLFQLIPHPVRFLDEPDIILKSNKRWLFPGPIPALSQDLVDLFFIYMT